jgi:hypothetical protein
MVGPRCHQGGHFNDGGSDWRFHGGLVVAVATMVLEATVVADSMSHPEIFISECEPFSQKNSNFLKDFINFYFYLNLSLI